MKPTEPKTTEPKKGGWLIESVVLLFSTLIGLVLVEAGYRLYLFYNTAVQANYEVSIVNAVQPQVNLGGEGNVFGPFPRSQTYTIRKISADNTVVSEQKIHANNLGWTSKYDLSPKKEPGEYRIIVIGGSTTAAVTNEHGWTDFTHEFVSRDEKLKTLGKYKKISVLGLGLPGANLGYFATPLAVIARRLEADLLVMNMSVEHITAQGHVVDFEALNRDLAGGRIGLTASAIVTKPVSGADLEFNGVGIKLNCPMHIKVISISDPECKVSNTWNVAPDRVLTSAEIRSVKQSVARARLLHTVLLAPRSLVLAELIGRQKAAGSAVAPSRDVVEDTALSILQKEGAPSLVSPEAAAGTSVEAASATDLQAGDDSTGQATTISVNAASVRPPPVSETAALLTGPRFIIGPLTPEQAAVSAQQMWEALRFIRELHPNLLIVNNPHIWHWTTPLATTIDKLLKQLADEGFDVADMTLRMPIQGGSQRWKSWYTEDGHWSDHGSEIYGKAVAGVIRERLLRENGVAPEPYGSPCGFAFDKFQEAKSSVEPGRAAPVEALNAAIALLPRDIDELLRRPLGSYADCGFVSDLYAERASSLELGGQIEPASADWKRAFEYNRERSAVLEKRIDLRLAQKNGRAALEDLGELLAAQPANAQRHLQRAEILATMGEGAAKDAAAAFSTVAKLRPDDIGNWFKAAQANMAAKNYEQVIYEVEQALKIDPRNAGMYFTRFNAYGGLGRWQDALGDLNKVIELLPKEVAFYRARASILEILGRKEEAKRDLETASKLEASK